MTSARVTRGIAVAVIALGIAGAGAAVNLRLIERPDQRVEPLSLSTTGTSADPAPLEPGTAEAPPSTGSSTTEPGSATSSTTATTSTPPPTVEATSTHAVGAAGTVVLSVERGAVTVVSVRLASGWTYETKRQAADEVELEFRRASDGARAELHARLEDGGRLRVETEDEGPDD
jgi:hypothetical protein